MRGWNGKGTDPDTMHYAIFTVGQANCATRMLAEPCCATQRELK
ncbi:hypothetical protein Enr10x_36750 [Gimesia panareensis]|uniref:Uncharacterized protein n=1 Tax=Gimesia panareensis TaxID=2527978 RepID=A0A517Q9N1_9PLAN|nr:hypothetical protein Enr10x_36750 [Gimesia panareensis]